MSVTIKLTFWAQKEGGHVKNWKRRWFVLLSDGHVRYFKAQDSIEQSGEIDLSGGDVYLGSNSRQR
jgi:hypothetical protein